MLELLLSVTIAPNLRIYAVSITENLKNSTRKGLVDKSGYYDTVVLGCTHYDFIKNEIFDHFQPQKLVSGNHFTAKAVQKYLKTQKSSVNYRGFEVLFVGENAKFNEKFCVGGGQKGQKVTKKLKKFCKKG